MVKAKRTKATGQKPTRHTSSCKPLQGCTVLMAIGPCHLRHMSSAPFLVSVGSRGGKHHTDPVRAGTVA
jgi:hypothetical protein